MGNRVLKPGTGFPVDHDLLYKLVGYHSTAKALAVVKKIDSASFFTDAQNLLINYS